eukprot:TRINITY_DN11608_c0_g1_i1.p1 TRINITY_DN11608_c0_g1~~TRINITY_DN11608_c0_g1_i1.p1  ORF type:complete len:439 (+),score=107.48 TRINITY_DN11608_c0_g1_i1:39-1355(+)
MYARTTQGLTKLPSRAYSSSLRSPISSGRTEQNTATTVQETVLDGNVRVISVDSPSSTTTVSLFVKAGSRFENRQTAGASHFLSKLAYRYTAQKSGIRTVRDLEHFGTQYSSKAGREFVEFHLKTPRTGSPALNIAVETLSYQLSPLLQYWQAAEVRPQVQADTDDVDSFNTLFQTAHFEAFRDSGLSNPTNCPAWNVSEIDNRHLHHHVTNNYFNGNEITVVGTGVDHSSFVDLVSPLFTKPTLKGNNAEIRAAKPLQITDTTSQSSKWVGGSVVRTPGPGDAKILVAYQGASYASADVATFTVLQELVNASLKNGNAFHVTYSDAGIFGIYGESANASQLSTELQSALKAATESISEEALNSAKTAAKVKFLSALEDSEQAAKLLATRGTGVLDTKNTLKQFDSVSVAALQKVVADSIKAGSVIVASGDVRGVAQL